MSRGVWVTVDSHGEHRRMRRYRAMLWEALEGQGAPCYWCGRPLRWCFDRPAPADNLEVDHVDFVDSNDISTNLVPCCRDCNRRRKNPENIGERCNAEMANGNHCARAVHTGPHASLADLSGETARKAVEAWQGKAPAQPEPRVAEQVSVCWYCGADLVPGVWVCGECGEEN